MSKKKETIGELTSKQEAFTLAFFETGNATDSYRRAYNIEESARDQWLYVEASQLLDNPKVALRLKELRAKAEQHSIYTRQQALDELEAARKEAMKLGAPAAAVSAINAKAKLSGLEPTAKQKVELSGEGGSPLAIVIRDMTKDA